MHRLAIGALLKTSMLLAALAATMALAQETQEGPAAAQPLEVTISPDGLELPTEVTAGYYYVQIDIEGTEGAPPSELAVDKLKEGTTLEDLVSAYENLNEQFATGGPGHEAIEQLTELAVAVGGYSEPPSAFELTPGEYMVGVTFEDGTFSHQGFTVGEAQASSEAPDVALTVDMLDFAFSIPDEVAQGEQMWEVRNVGEQVHHMIMMRLNEGATVDDAMAFLESGEGEPPGEEIGWTAILSPGVSNYINYDLAPGDYFVICFLPDYETGQPHFMLGMTDSFTVAGE